VMFFEDIRVSALAYASSRGSTEHSMVSRLRFG
jgi:hypothetical protein